MSSRWNRTAAAAAALLLVACSATTTVRDLAGRPLDPLASADARAIVLVFADPECPISNAYAPELRRLHGEFEPRGARFFLVYADRDRSLEELRAHATAFAYPMTAVFDREHELVERSGATLTPEACVFLPGGVLVYRGRIDDRYVDFGKQRAAPTTRDLKAALEAVLAGRAPAEPWPPAIGCAIPAAQD
jgi:hypothetical protein